MRLLILTSEFDPYRGGIGTYARELAVAAVEMGYHVEVLAPDYHKDQSLLDSTFPFVVRRYRGGQHTMRDLFSKIRLVRAIADSEDFDVVHAVDWPFFIPLSLSGFRSRSRCLVTFHGTEITYMRDAKRRFVLQALGFWRGWAQFVTNSRFTTNLLVDSFPNVSARSVRTIGLGVKDSWKVGRVDKAVAREMLGISGDRFVLVTLGRVVRRKGHLVLAQALSRLPDSVSKNISWYVVGPHYDESFLSELRACVATLKVTTSITGPLSESELKTVLSSGDLFCLPGYWDNSGQVEGFGLAYVEAGAFGLPAVATDVGGVSDAVLDGQTGILVKPEDPQVVADAVLDLYLDREKLDRLSKGAQRYADESTWLRVAEKTYSD